MKSALLLVSMLVSCASVASAVDVTWIGPSDGTWDTPANWSSGVVPNSNTIRVLKSDATNMRFWGTGATYTIGEFNGTGGSIQAWISPNNKLICDNAAGLSGSFLMPVGYNSTYAAAMTIDVMGDFVIGAGPFSSQVSLDLRGSRPNQGYLNLEGGGGDHPLVNVWGSYYDCGSNLGQGRHIRTLDLKSGGRLAGGTWGVGRLIVEPGSSIATGTNFCFIGNSSDNTAPNQTTIPHVLPGGVTLPGQVTIGPSYNGFQAGNTHLWSLDGGGDLAVTGELRIGDTPAVNPPVKETTVLLARDCGTGTSRNISAGTLSVGDQRFDSNWSGLFRGGSGTHTVTGSVNVGYGTRTSNNYAYGNGALALECCTLRVGGDWNIVRNPNANNVNTDRKRGSEFIDANWDPGTSTVIFNGTGTQTFYGEGMPLYNVEVNKSAGSFLLSNEAIPAGFPNEGQLMHPLLVRHNLLVTAGAFVGNGVPIVFNGPDHRLTNLVNPSGYQFDDNINLFPSAVLGLGSDITIKTGDNLNMGSGSVLYLCGFTLSADGKVYSGSLTGMSWRNDGGTIYALSNVPEPATLALLGTGLMGLLGWTRRKRTR